jgi:hypothetical protein
MISCARGRYRIGLPGYVLDDVVDFLGWQELSRIQMDDDIIRRFHDVLHWPYLSLHLSDAILEEFAHKVDWSVYFASSPTQDVALLYRLKSYIPVTPALRQYYKYPEFIDAFCECIDWAWYATQAPPPYLMMRYWDAFAKANNALVRHAHIPEEIICAHVNRLSMRDWQDIAIHQVLSSEFIIQHHTQLSPVLIAEHQRMDENAIALWLMLYPDTTSALSRQAMSDEFIEANLNRLDMDVISYTARLSYGFLQRNINKLKPDLLYQNNSMLATDSPIILKDRFNGYVIMPPRSSRREIEFIE